MIPKLKKKNFPLVCRACRVKSIDIQVQTPACYATGKAATTSKKQKWNSKIKHRNKNEIQKSISWKSLACRACQDESIDI